ncbi:MULTISPECIES: peptide MFS transporter [unclassified Sphingomonas]|uniref:peptide MFS transporter n=1 Tax=unclassified Sphingomonas TaxID=196159 RepID=UPI0006F39D8F|nr:MULTISPECIES: peptide MFS transporter [unclassified Sphingomonas]KQX25621.1 peptide ABC transporter [Sphingomonas sp. Root1294]KQY66612.1 peptide ABC transporter [Sphingomonas sp. Root50]KRB90064.1 peptide ABC transporter [Sphingomonas sp. Root720]
MTAGPFAPSPAAPAAPTGVAGRTLFGHPPGLTSLFLTQMWAEFSYFGLQALLVYYMTRHLNFSQGQSSLIYGLYGAAAFFSPFFGGIVADRWLGRKRSVVLGGVLMMIGHFLMAFEGLLFPALALVALGNGLFIPPLAVQVGSLYAEDDPRRAQAFSAYYMGINLGGLLAPLVCGTLGELYGWHWGFSAAGIGMAVGLAIYLGSARLLPPEPVLGRAGGGTKAPLGPADWRNLRLLLGIVLVIVLFRIAYEQSGNVIALWVAHQTDRHVTILGHGVEVPATWFQAVNPLLIILLTPLLMRWWRRHDHDGTPAALLRRMSLGCAISVLSMLVMVAAAAVYGSTGRPVGSGWVLVYFLFLTVGELLTLPVGLSLIGMLSPVQIAAMLMGAWYIAKFLGSLLAGIMGAYWGVIPATAFFAIGALSVSAAAVLLQLMSRQARLSAD